ncbi:MAG: hypothetical protein R2784_14475 [Saprospiraceae bacterium]
MTEKTDIDDILAYYMGKNTPTRQEFIIDNLPIEKDLTDENGNEIPAEEEAVEAVA